MIEGESWHRWFAWFPVLFDAPEGHPDTRAWLEYVERKGTYVGDGTYGRWSWEYRELED